MVISIHQPNFMPYYPFFQKMAESDVFVLLTHVQFEKNGYQNRFNYKDEWYTMAIESGLDPIIDKRYIKAQKDWDKIKSKLPQFDLSIFDDCVRTKMSVMNTEIIHKAATHLKIDTPIYQDYHTDKKSTEMLIDICKYYEADEYLSGISGTKYLDTELFKHHGIKLSFQDERKMIKKALIEML